MKPEKIVQMAREAGAIPIHKDYAQQALVGNKNIERFAAMVAAAEREACAQVAENCFEGVGKHKPIIMAVEAAKAIRARGNT